jgi:Beta-propeller repeat
MPVLSYSSYLGANGAECLAIATDEAGNIYIAGRTAAAGIIPVVNAFQPTSNGGGSDVFVAKLDPTGTNLIYSTYLGGTGNDEGLGIAVDRQENAYVTGVTTSPNLPVTPGAFQTALAGGSDAFVAKLDPNGGLVYCTYLGGSADDRGIAIAVDPVGSAYVTGSTRSTNFPVRGRGPWWRFWRRPGVLQPTYGGGWSDAFVTKLDPTGSALVYSTYLGGTGSDSGTGIGLCGDYWPHITGVTDSPNFPTTPNAFQSAPVNPGVTDVFFTKLNFTGSLVYSTYLGGNGNDQGTDIAVTGNADAFITGATDSANFPTTPGAFQTALGGVQDAFAVRFDRWGKLVYSTYLGGSGLDQGLGIGMDQAGNAFVVGMTQSPNFPQSNPVQPGYGGPPTEAFVAMLDPKGSALPFSTFLGGSSDELAAAVAVSLAGSAFVTGWTYSPNFPTKNPLQGTLGGSPDAFIAVLS